VPAHRHLAHLIRHDRGLLIIYQPRSEVLRSAFVEGTATTQ